MKKVLIFDDDEDILAICKFILEEAGWQVRSYPDCRELIARITAFAPDVILMDNWIPEQGGVVATQMIKSTYELQTIPVIYFSANIDIKSLATAAGAEYYLAKPFDLEVLKSTLSAVVVPTS